MVDEKIADYVKELLDNGYDINIIENQLINSGHNAIKTKLIIERVFKEYFKDIFEYIEEELKKEKNIIEIKEELIAFGYSEDVIKKAIKFHSKSKKTFREKLSLHELFNRESKWFKDWIRIYIIIFSLIIILILLISLPFILNIANKENHSSYSNYCDRLFGTNSSINEQFYLSLCYSFHYNNIDLCDDLDSFSNRCKDFHYLYKTYKNNSNACSSISNINIKEVCFDVSQKNCRNIISLSIFCNSVIMNSPVMCENNNQLTLNSLTCLDNYFMYYSLNNNNPGSCSRISDENSKNLCYYLTET